MSTVIGKQTKKKAGLFVRMVRGIVVIFVGLMALGYFASKDDKQAAASTEREAPVAHAASEPPLSVTAGKLFRDYQANEVAADNIYKGHRLDVTGSVQSINKDFADGTYVQLRTDNEFMGVHANLEKSEVAAAAGLARGQQISVVCTGGGMLVGSPILRECQISG